MVLTRNGGGRNRRPVLYPIEVLQFADNQRVKFNEQNPQIVRGVLKVRWRSDCKRLVRFLGLGGSAAEAP